MRTFQCLLNKDELKTYMISQLNYFFPDGKNNNLKLDKIIDLALQRTEYCFLHIKGKYYGDNKNVYFNYLNGDHYSMFLYFISREAFLSGLDIINFKFSLLNKHLFSIDLFGSVEMPEIFLLVHPVGTIIHNKTKIKNYFVLYQGVTIGSIQKLNTVLCPVFQEGTVCFAKSSIIGNATFGKNTIIGANTNIIGGIFPDNSTIVGNYPDIKIKKNNVNVLSDFFFL